MLRTILTALAGSVLLASGVSAQQSGRQHGDTTSMRNRPMMDMMTMSMMDSADARLDRLVSTMNQATGSRKVQAIAAVINELVTQRKTMRTHARQMMGPGGMMGRDTGRKIQKMGPTSADTAPTPAKPDTADHGQHHKP